MIWIQFEITRPVPAIKSLRFALFMVIYQISRSHGSKNCQFWPELSVSGLWLQFEFTDGFEMMHKAWCSIKEVPYYFSKSSTIKFQGYRGCKIDDLNPICIQSKITRPVAAIKIPQICLVEHKT